MNDDAADGVRASVDAVYRAELRRVLATLIRLLVWNGGWVSCKFYAAPSAPLRGISGRNGDA